MEKPHPISALNTPAKSTRQQLALNQRDTALPNLRRALSIFQEIGDRTREQKLRLFLEQQGFVSDF